MKLCLQYDKFTGPLKLLLAKLISIPYLSEFCQSIVPLNWLLFKNNWNPPGKSANFIVPYKV